MSVAALHPFDRDTALEPVSDGLWRGSISERWWIVLGPFGGYVSTFFTRALAELAPGRAPRSLTVHFLEAPQAGPFELSGAVERAGGSMTSVSARMTQDGTTRAVALASAAPWKEGQSEWQDLSMPQLPGPDDCPPVRATDKTPRFFENFDIRFADGGSPVRAHETAYNAAWLRHRPPRELDHAAVTALSDGWMPAAFSRLGRLAVVPTLDLTIHFRAPLPHAGEWTLVTNTSALGAGGAWDQDTAVWAQDGTLLAQARQLALVRG